MIDTLNGYATIKQIAKACGCRVTDLLALSEKNDPFYAGMPSRRKAGKWFAELWERFGFGHGVHLRRVHYRFVSQDPPILKPNGEPYYNTENDWNYLGIASLAARYLKMVPAESFVDRRNPDPQIYYATAVCDPSIEVYSDTPEIYLPSELGLPHLLTTGFHRQQDYFLEIWCEKSTMNDVLVPLSRELGINLVTGVGEMSDTSCRNLINRLVDADRPARILYVSDFDPAGRSMPKAVARKIEFQVYGRDLDIELQPIILTPEQCTEYNLPRSPIKKTERRATKFEKRFGEGATELDALEALYPGELEKIVRENVERYIDPTLQNRVVTEENETDRWLDHINSNVHARYADRIEFVQSRYQELLELAAEIKEECEELWESITEDLENVAPYIGEHDVPRAREPNPHKDPLFDSKRSYIEQLDRYKNWKEGNSTQHHS